MLEAKRETVQLYRSDDTILDFVRRANEGGYLANVSDVERELGKTWSGNFAKKTNHLVRLGLLRPVARSMTDYEKEKLSCTYRVGKVVGVLRHRDGDVRPAFMLGEKYVNGSYDLRIEKYG